MNLLRIWFFFFFDMLKECQNDFIQDIVFFFRSCHMVQDFKRNSGKIILKD